MNLIEKLGLEKCKQIVDGAPELATLFYYFGKGFEHRVDYYKHFFNYLQMWLPDHGWFPAPDYFEEGTIKIDDLRTALADHDRTDTCSDIKNHISPNTKVIEHG